MHPNEQETIKQPAQQPQSVHSTHVEVAPQGVIIHRMLPGVTFSIPIAWPDYDQMVSQVAESRQQLVSQIQAATPEQVLHLKRHLKA